MGRITLVTGTDTGVGKSLLAACLVHHLRASGIEALAVKPFCTGSRSDARLLQKASGGSLSLDEVNPFFFEPPLAPYVAAKCPVHLEDLLEFIARLSKRCDHLLVEGAGGVLTPLGKTFFISDVKAEAAVLVARNRLGAINHTLLAAKFLRPKAIALMGQKVPDLASQSNAKTIRSLLPEIPVVEIPYLGPAAKRRVEELAEKIAPQLASLLGQKKPHRNAV